MNNAEWFLIGCLSAFIGILIVWLGFYKAETMNDDEQFDYHSNFSDIEIKGK